MKPEVFEQASDAGGAEFDGHQVDCNRCHHFLSTGDFYRPNNDKFFIKHLLFSKLIKFLGSA